LNYCWLANTSGKPDGFLPIDLLQEHNVRDIKVSSFFFIIRFACTHDLQHTFSVKGPFADWDYIGQTSASIPCQRKVKDHVEDSINHYRRYKAHTSPEKEEDITRLQASYQASQIHVYRAGRTLDAKDKVSDAVRIGSDLSKLPRTVEKWIAGRISEWSNTEDWTDY
jgi:hypothetical protein